MTKLGEVGAGAGTRAPRAQLTPKLEGTCSVRGERGAAAAASAARPDSPNPQGAEWGPWWLLGKGSGRPGAPGERVRPHSDTPARSRSHLDCSKVQGCVGTRRSEQRPGGGTATLAKDPGDTGGGDQPGTAAPLPPVTPKPGRPAAERAPGAAPVHVGQRARARPAPSLAALRARSTWSAAARPRGRRRPAAAGIG